MDRSIGKFLLFPVFDGEFREALGQLGLDHVEFWLALADWEGGADQGLSSMLPALTENEVLRAQLLCRLDQALILADLVKASAHRVQAEIASDLGYGSAGCPAPRLKRKVDGEPAAASGPDGLVGGKPLGPGSGEVVASLQGAEDAERRKWGDRLRKISERAGAAAGVNDPRSTIRAHVRVWEKFEEWAAGQERSVYPPEANLVLRYALHLRDQGCGPAVIPAMRYGIAWICKRLVMKAPEDADQRLQALVDRVHGERGKELKEAVPMHPRLVVALELMVVRLAREEQTALALLAWWALILIYASLRFDDGVHVSPKSLQVTDEALFGVVWQTKVERRRGTRFAAPRCSLSDLDWVKVGWEVFQPFLSDREHKTLVLKYARRRKELALTMVRDVTAQLKDEWKPDPAHFIIEEEDAEVGAVPIEYIVRKSLPKSALDDAAFRCHILDPRVSQDVSICGRLKLEQAVSVGAIAPGLICAPCKARAERSSAAGSAPARGR